MEAGKRVFSWSVSDVFDVLSLTASASISLALICLVMPWPSHAKGSDDVPSITVGYSELDLSQQDDVRRLYARLKWASDRVCAHLDGRGLQRAALYRTCYQDALTRAVADVDHDALTALHFDRPTIRLAAPDSPERSAS